MRAADMISEKIVERAVPGKGVGVVAVAEIAAGELLVAEQPLLVMEDWSPDHLLAAWTKLPRASQVSRIRTRNVCCVEFFNFDIDIRSYSQYLILTPYERRKGPY